jgi:hypothetical protein
MQESIRPSALVGKFAAVAMIVGGTTLLAATG